MKTKIPDIIYKNINKQYYDSKRIETYFKYLDAFVYKGILYKRIAK